jgi:ornithine carbamoyltransferase
MLKGRDLLTLEELSKTEITGVLDVADILKEERRRGLFRPLLAGKSVALIFQKPSTRTRVSFETGLFELGGHALNLTSSELQLARGETIEDTAKTLSRYVNAIMARVYSHDDAVSLAEAASVPVVNGLSDSHHPCQILGDLQTIRETKGRLQGLKLAWVGDGDNVCNTLLIGCSTTGINIRISTPKGYEPDERVLKKAYRLADHNNSHIELLENPERAVEDADVVVTDTFTSMGTEKQREERIMAFFPRYQVNSELMKKAKSDAIFMHCLPAHRGEEVTSEIMDGPQSVVWQEAENRLHAQKALLCLILLDDNQLPW